VKSRPGQKIAQLLVCQPGDQTVEFNRLRDLEHLHLLAVRMKHYLFQTGRKRDASNTSHGAFDRCDGLAGAS
jgi:hypothetical protein